MSEFPSGFFVYGTLKRGEQRSRLWPHAPREVFVATLAADLFDLGPYPAIATGSGSVTGELWVIAPQHMADTIERLDWVEGFHPTGCVKNIYERRLVNCRDEAGKEHSAFAYFYADTQELARIATQILPGVDGRTCWTGHRE